MSKHPKKVSNNNGPKKTSSQQQQKSKSSNEQSNSKKTPLVPPLFPAKPSISYDPKNSIDKRITDLQISKNQLIPNKLDNPILEEKLNELKLKLKKSFSANFVESICYFIKCENKRQSNLEANIEKIQWSKLDHFLQTLKKMCKQKHHLLLLFQKLQISNVATSLPSASNPTATRIKKNQKTFSIKDESREELYSEVDDFANPKEENFSLVKIIIRFLFKLFKINNYGETKRQEIVNDQNKFLNLQLVLLSCLADICFYEELRIQVINDANLQCLFKIFILTTNYELDETPSISTSPDSTVDRFRNVKKYWSKMCRLSANLCQDKNSMKMKNLFTREFISSLCSCMEKQSQFLQSQLNLANCDSNANDLDLYHSLIRLIKFSYQVKKCKDLILETRLLVYISRTMFKYNKNLTLLVEGLSESAASIEPPNETTIPIQTIYINKKSQSLCKELVRHYLNMLEGWPQPICNEFYNQIIEGSAIEHLLWLHIDDPLEQKSITSMKLDQCKKIEQATESSTKQESSKSTFNYSEFSFNLLLKFCHEYHVCRAEFGRVGGLNKYLTNIEAINTQIAAEKDSLNNNLSKETLRTYGKLIEMVCFNCKESVNRLRLKEQGHLSMLVKNQKDLKAEKLKVILKNSNENSYQELCSDSSIHNKLLVAMCCFAHDQDSMNILLSNGLVDQLLGFLNDSIMYDNENTAVKNVEITKEKPEYTFEKYGSCLLKHKESKPVFLNNLLQQQEANNPSEEASNGKKRKASDPLQSFGSISTPSTSNSLKRSKLNQTAPAGQQQQVFAHPAGLLNIDPNSNIDFEQQFQFNQLHQAQNPQPTSPDSYCSLSPTSNPFSPAFSPSSPTMYRSSSAVMSSNTLNNSSSNLYSSFSPSPSYNDMSSPKFNWQNNEDHSFNIQFSPTIERLDSDDEINENSNDTKIEQPGGNILKSEYDEIMIVDNDNCQAQDEIDLTGDDKAETSHDQSMKFNLDSSNCTNEQTDGDAKLAALLNTSKNSEETQNIEAIHRTEACVFYVLSQLSHGDKPSIYLFNNFESITICLLNYLKNAKVRNPRALRILNRLTKNHYCFYNLVSTQFPYKIKSVFFKDLMEKLKISENSNNKSLRARRITTSSSCTDLEKLKPTLSLTSSKSMICFNEQDIEKEMNIYLNSNKVFFDAHTFFPSFESIEFTLLNNLKMQCISSSDHGYLSLVSMMKAFHKKSERLSCALVAPFILRNSKALQNIMVNLNGVDLIVDQILPALTYDTDETNSTTKSSTSKQTDFETCLQYNSILCIRKILRFVNYKYDTKRLKDNFENFRSKLIQNIQPVTKETTDNQVKFLFNENTTAEKSIEINSERLASQSEYFNALLRGGFSEGNQQNLTIPIKDISFEVFSIIMSMIMNGSKSDHEISLNTCIELILAGDKLFLTEIKDFFISVLLDRFLNMSNCFICFRLAWYLDSKLLEKETIEFFLSRFYEIDEKAPKAERSQRDEKTKDSEYENLDESAKCIVLIDYALESFKENSENMLINQNKLQIIETNSIQERQLIEHFKKTFKDAIIQIIHK